MKLSPRANDAPRGAAAARPGVFAPVARIARAWAAWRSARPQPAPLVEELEARLMYAADPAGAGLALAGAVIEQRLVDNSGEFIQVAPLEQRSHELLIVGAGIADSRTLVEGLARDGRDIEVLELDPEADSIGQITAALAGRHDLSAIHILSHGSSGELQLGADKLDAATMAARAGDVGRWGDALRVGGDILLYGCDVAGGDAGAVFVRQLAALTGADVAASNNLTGDSSMHADWLLEVRTGQIDSAIAFTTAAQAQWHGTLETPANSVTKDKQHEAAVAVSASGSFVVTWTADHDQDGNNTGVFAQRFDANGNPVGGQIQVNTQYQDRQESSAVGMAADGSFVVVWASHNQQVGDTDGWGVKAQRFAADGSRIGSEFLVNQSTAKDQFQPSLSVAANGQFVIAWTSSVSNDIYVRHYDASGAALSGEVLASGVNGAGNQILPSVAIGADGSYVVAWQTDSGGSAKSIYAQRFNTNDTLRGAGFKVNTYDADDQTQPSLAMGGNGNFVVAWTSAKQDGDANGVYAQLYRADGTRIGAEFQVNTVVAHDQSHASAAMDGAGNFTIAWNSSGEDNGASIGVYAQRYSAGGVALGSAFLVNGTTAGNQTAPAAAMNGSGTLAIAWEGAGIGDVDGVFVAFYSAGNTAPTANPDAVSVLGGGQATSTGSGVLANDFDPDSGDVLAVAGLLSPADGSLLAVTDGGISVAGLYGTLFIRADGSYLYRADGAAARALAAGQSGSDAFTYIVRDHANADAASTLTFNVTGVNDAPVAVNDAYAVDRSQPLDVAAGGVLANDTDVDRNPADVLKVVSVNNMTAAVGAAVAGVYGTLRINADGSLSYVPNSADPTLLNLAPGSSVFDDFSYGISDGRGGVATASLRITLVASNRAPVASDDSGAAYTLQQDTSLTLDAASGVLRNDVDPDYNVLSAELLSGPSHGTLRLNADGSFVYTPVAGYYGPDSFRYLASDGSRTSAANVLLNIVHVNHAPSAVDDDAAATASAGTALDALHGLLANDGDIDAGDNLAVASIQYGDQVITLTPGTKGSVVTDYGTLTVGSDGAFSYVADGAASMRLGQGAISSDSFSYTVSDGQGGFSIAWLQVAITGVNDTPAISVGAGGGQTITDQGTYQPFTNVVISDVDSPAQQLTVRVALDDPAKGALYSALGGSYDAAKGIYSFTGSPEDATAAVNALRFTPIPNLLAPGLINTTRFTISADDGFSIASDSSTVVGVSSINDAPVISGTTAAQAVADNATLRPFAGVTIADADNPAQQLTVRVVLDNPAQGTLSGSAGSYDAGAGVYTFTGTAAEATVALRALAFTPTANRLAPGASETTRFTISANDGIATSTNASTTVVTTSINDVPIITGTTAAQAVADNATLQPFAGVTIADADNPAQQLTIRVTLDNPAQGALSGSAGSFDAGAGVYTFTGTAAEATVALRALAFTPTANRITPGATETTRLTISADDGMASSTASTTVITTSINDAPVITGTTATQAVADNATLQPFAGVTIADADNPAQQLTVRVVLDNPAQGALSGSAGSYDVGAGVYTFTGTPAEATVALRALAFTPTANRITPGATETTRFTISADDGMDNSTASTTVITTSINDAPVITGATATQAVADNATLQPFAGVTIADADNPAQQLTIRITLDNPVQGTLSGSAGSFDAGGGVYTFTGTAAEATVALRALAFTPTANRLTPGATETTRFTISADDGAASSTASTTVVTTSINDAPVITGTTATQAIADNATLQPFAGVTIADADNPAQQLTIRVTLDNPAQGALSGSAGSFDAGAGVYTFTGTAAEATVALRALAFTPTANRITPGATETTRLTISADDGTVSSTASTTVVATSINDAPVIIGTTATQAVADNATLQPFAGVTIADADNPAQQLTIRVVLDNPAQGTLSGSAGSFDAASGVYTFTGTAAEATVALRALAFTPTANRLTPGATETARFTISADDGAASSMASTSVVITSINDAPVITGATATQAVADNATLQPFAGVTIADADNPAQQLTVRVVLDNPAQGTLSGSAGSYDAGAGVYTFTGTAAEATVALRALAFTPTANRLAPGASETTRFTISADDGAASSTASTSVVITSINDAPVITGTTAAQAVADNATLQPFAGVTIADADNPAQQLTIRITLDNPVQGTLSGSAGSYDAGAGVYTFTGTAAEATVALRALSFTPTANRLAPGATETTRFTISADDGMANSTASTTVVTTSINDAPVITGTTATQAIADNATLQPFAGVTIADADNPAQQLTIRVVLDSPAQGALSSSAGSFDAASGVYLFTGTAAEATVALRALSFTPTANRIAPGASETTRFIISADDGTASSTASTTVVTTSINDAPVITGTTATQAIADNATLQPFAGVTIADADNPAQQLTIRVTLDNPAQGALSGSAGSFDAGAGVYTFTGTAAEATVALRALAFTPTANRITPGATETARFTISADDGAASSTASTSVVTTSINDAPVITGITATQAVADNATLQPFAGVTIADADNPAQQLTVRVVLDNPAQGTLSGSAGSFDAASGVYMFTGTAAQATDALRALVFVPAANRMAPGASTPGLLTLTIDDGQASAATSVSLRITSINDAPVLVLPTGALTVSDKTSIAPFAGMAVADADSPAQQLTLRITLDDPAKGGLSAAVGNYDAATGAYTFTGTAAQLNAAAQALLFTPAENRTAPGLAETATFSISVDDGLQRVRGVLSVDALSVNDAPVALAVNARGVQDSAAVAIVLAASDADADAISLVITSTPAKGRLYFDAAGLSPLLPGARLQMDRAATQIYFLPEPGWHGETGFSYAAVDAHGLAGASAAVSITVAPALRNAAQPTAAPAVEANAAPASLALERPAEPAAATAPASTLLASAGIAVAAPQQLDVAAPAPETMLPAPLNQRPAPGATPAHSSAERVAQAAAARLAAGTTAEAISEAVLAADLSAAQALADALIERGSAAMRSESLARSLDDMRDSVSAADEAEHRIVGASVAVGTGFSVGYVIWLLRGGVLATSLLSSLPAWRFVDPLPVLARMRQGADGDDSDDSLESLVAGDDVPGGHDAAGPQPWGSKQ